MAWPLCRLEEILKVITSESGINGEWDCRRHFVLQSNDTLGDGENFLPGSKVAHYIIFHIFSSNYIPTSTIDDIEARIGLNGPSQ